METFAVLMEKLNNFVWGPPMMILLLGVGLFLTVGLRFISLTKIGYGFNQLFKKRDDNAGQGEVSPFAALMTALSSTVGTGNIAGVAAAIAIGGPGAVFWMWVTAILGTATKFGEGVLAVRFREVDSNGNRVGGPMYYIKNGLGPKWLWLAGAFAFFGIIKFRFLIASVLFFLTIRLISFRLDYLPNLNFIFSTKSLLKDSFINGSLVFADSAAVLLSLIDSVTI